MTVPRELQGPERGRTILIGGNVLHSFDNESTEILILEMLRLKSTY